MEPIDTTKDLAIKISDLPNEVIATVFKEVFGQTSFQECFSSHPKEDKLFRCFELLFTKAIELQYEEEE